MIKTFFTTVGIIAHVKNNSTVRIRRHRFWQRPTINLCSLFKIMRISWYLVTGIKPGTLQSRVSRLLYIRLSQWTRNSKTRNNSNFLIDFWVELFWVLLSKLELNLTQNWNLNLNKLKIFWVFLSFFKFNINKNSKKLIYLIFWVEFITNLQLKLKKDWKLNEIYEFFD